jgi:hypothetical protein
MRVSLAGKAPSTRGTGASTRARNHSQHVRPGSSLRSPLPYSSNRMDSYFMRHSIKNTPNVGDLGNIFSFALWVPRPANRYCTFTHWQPRLCASESMIVVSWTRSHHLLRVVEIHSIARIYIRCRTSRLSSLQISPLGRGQPTSSLFFTRLDRKSQFKFCASTSVPERQEAKGEKGDKLPPLLLTTNPLCALSGGSKPDRRR